jgi:hypothetical protein
MSRPAPDMMSMFRDQLGIDPAGLERVGLKMKSSRGQTRGLSQTEGLPPVAPVGPQMPSPSDLRNAPPGHDGSVLDRNAYGLASTQDDSGRAVPQMTPGEMDQMGELPIFDERMAELGRGDEAAKQLRKGIKGGPSPGTYGRWGTPMPYTKGNAFADALREGVASYREDRSAQESKKYLDEAKKILSMYAKREANPDLSPMEANLRKNAEADLAKTPMPRPDLGASPPSIADKLMAFGQKYRPRLR